MQKVTIHVVAGPNQGKTTITSIIQDALRAWGFKDVTVLDMPASEDKPPIMERMVAATQRPIEIKVSQLQKVMCHNCKEHEVAYPGAKFCGAGCSQLWEMRPR